MDEYLYIYVYAYIYIAPLRLVVCHTYIKFQSRDPWINNGI